MNNPANDILEQVRKELLASDGFKALGCEVFLTSQPGFEERIGKALAEASGLAIALSMTTATSNSPAIEMDFDLVVTELAPINRASDDYSTAEDVAFAAVRALDGATWHWVSMRNDVAADKDGNMVYQTTASFKCEAL